LRETKSEPRVLTYEPRKRLRASDYLKAYTSGFAYFIVLCFVVALARLVLFGKDGDEGFMPVGHVVDVVVSLGVPTCVGVLQYFAKLRERR
jgi:hypothetical protein